MSVRVFSAVAALIWACGLFGLIVGAYFGDLVVGILVLVGLGAMGMVPWTKAGKAQRERGKLK